MALQSDGFFFPQDDSEAEVQREGEASEWDGLLSDLRRTGRAGVADLSAKLLDAIPYEEGCISISTIVASIALESDTAVEMTGIIEEVISSLQGLLEIAKRNSQ